MIVLLNYETDVQNLFFDETLIWYSWNIFGGSERFLKFTFSNNWSVRVGVSKMIYMYLHVAKNIIKQIH